MPKLQRLPYPLLAACLLWLPAQSVMADEVTVYAAASLTNALDEIAKTYESEHHVRIKTSFAASGTLAKQIEAGAPADVYIAADGKWMDYLDGKGKIDHDSRVDLLGNNLVLIAPKGRSFPVRMEQDFNFAQSFTGKLCTGEPASVPVGIYAKEALTKLGWWDAIKQRVVGTDDVRAALDLVARGECIGVVYGTDAKTSAKVDIIADFPAATHSPIVYPAALVTQKQEAQAFFNYLREVDKVFILHGFKPLN